MSNLEIKVLDLETDQIGGRTSIIESALVSNDPSKNNQNISIKSRLNRTNLMDCRAFAVQNASLNDLNSPDRISSYKHALFLDRLFNLPDEYILAAHNAKFEIDSMNQNSFTNLLQPYVLSKRKPLDTLDIFRTASVLDSINFDFFNPETGKYSVSMGLLTRLLLEKEEVHRAYDDAVDTINTLKIVFKKLPEIETLINHVYDDTNRDKLLESPLLMRPSFSPTNGPSSQLITKLDNYDWNNWDLILTIPEEFTWEGEINDLANKLKEKAKPSVIKTKGVVIFFPNYSNTFKKHYPNYPDEKIAQIINVIRQDGSYINLKKQEMRTKYSKPKKPDFDDTFHVSDGFFSPHDRYNAQLFHNGDPAQKYQLCNEFEDKRLIMNAKIIMLHNYRNVMTNKDIQDVLDYELSELEKPEASRVTFETFMKSYDEVCSDPKWSKEVIDNLNEYKAHVLALKANPKLFLEV